MNISSSSSTHLDRPPSASAIATRGVKSLTSGSLQTGTTSMYNVGERLQEDSGANRINDLLPKPSTTVIATRISGTGTGTGTSTFVENIKRWTLLDNHLKIIQEKTKQIREERHQLTNSICDYLTDNNLTNKKIGIHDGDIRICEKKEYSPLTFGYLEERLGEIIPDKSHVDFIIQYMKEHRQIKTNPDLKRTYTKS